MDKIIKFKQPTKQVTIKQDPNLIPGNVKKGITIEGIVGTLESPTIAEKYQLDMNKVTYDEAGLGILTMTQPPKQIVVAKDSDLEPENIKNGITIEGIEGTYEPAKQRSIITLINQPYEIANSFMCSNIPNDVSISLGSILYDSTNLVYGIYISNFTNPPIVYTTSLNNGFVLNIRMGTTGSVSTRLLIQPQASTIYWVNNGNNSGTIEFTPPAPIFMQQETLSASAEVDAVATFDYDDAKFYNTQIIEDTNNTLGNAYYISTNILNDVGGKYYRVKSIKIDATFSEETSKLKFDVTITGMDVK